RRVVIVHRAGEDQEIREAVATEGLSREIEYVEGGKERFESVHRGLTHLRLNPPKVILIHDSARPFLTDRMIDQSIQEASHNGGCTVAIPLTDTLKRSDGEMLIETLPRDSLYRIQTPQTFDYQFLLEAHEEFHQAPVKGITDDCMLLERKGFRIGLVLGDERNIKVTTPFDLKLAEVIYRESVTS
ncbi:MAG: 2-C-methyl-D-erythritol 4-phosphate cytidylyltransferase, partial [Candidatus Omnitrophica bacterium]|nr:2-C-methyl-D-erythritol 4-phosphate cytidylyltransferase [Candidatus Omnitrophota bacterium]